MLKAEWQCWHQHTRPYGWTLAITQTIMEIKYWWYTQKQNCTGTTNAHYAVCLACKLQLPPLQPDMTEPDIIQHITESKTQLQKLWGDPKW